LDNIVIKDIEKQFGRRVRDLREAKHISQEELAFKAGMHRTYLGGIERGERNPALKNINALAKALEVDIAELFRFKAKK
jgi:transcriptional regulator with XRE-family HTH domain